MKFTVNIDRIRCAVKRLLQETAHGGQTLRHTVTVRTLVEVIRVREATNNTGVFPGARGVTGKRPFRVGVSLDIENYCTLRWFFVPLSSGRP